MNTTLQPHNSSVEEALRRIKLLSLDVDGILTDGGIYYADDGNSFRKFNAKDGVGVNRLMKTGIDVVIISAGAPGAIEHRARRMGIKHVFTDVGDKLSVLRELSDRLGIEMADVAHMGDDVIDLEIMEAVGFSFTASDAVDEVLDYADIITKNKGGEGAVREVCDLLLRVQNLSR